MRFAEANIASSHAAIGDSPGTSIIANSVSFTVATLCVVVESGCSTASFRCPFAMFMNS